MLCAPVFVVSLSSCTRAAVKKEKVMWDWAGQAPKTVKKKKRTEWEEREEEEECVCDGSVVFSRELHVEAKKKKKTDTTKRQALIFDVMHTFFNEKGEREKATAMDFWRQRQRQQR